MWWKNEGMKVIILNSRCYIVGFYENELPLSLRSHHSLVSFRDKNRQNPDSIHCDRCLFAHKRATAINLELMTPDSNASD